MKKEDSRPAGEQNIRYAAEADRPERTANQDGRLRITNVLLSEAPRRAPSGPAGCATSMYLLL